MIGMDRNTGRQIEGDAHLAQSIADILTTLVGTRVMRRDYGSLLPALIDAPGNAAGQVRLFGAAATALMRQEPRFRATGFAIVPAPTTAGAYQLEVVGERADSLLRGASATFAVPLQ